MVGRAVAARLDELGHDVPIGTRNPEDTLARTEPDAMGTAPFSPWQQSHDSVELLTYADAHAHAHAHGEIIVNATNGANSLRAPEATGAHHLAGRVLLDIALALDLSQGMPPKLLVVVQTLNTVCCEIMVAPSSLPGAHQVFVAGDDPAAKDTARSILGEFGWAPEAILDLGSIEAAGAVELCMPLYFTLHGVLDTFDFNISVVRA